METHVKNPSPNIDQDDLGGSIDVDKDAENLSIISGT